MASIKKATENKSERQCKNQSENKKSKKLFALRRKYYRVRKKEKLEIKKTTKTRP